MHQKYQKYLTFPVFLVEKKTFSAPEIPVHVKTFLKFSLVLKVGDGKTRSDYFGQISYS